MPHSKRHSFRVRMVFVSVLVVALFSLGALLMPEASHAGEAEYVGSLSGQLVPNTNDFDQIIFRPLRDLTKVKFATPPESGAEITAGRLYDPLRDKSAILTLLVLAEDETPVVYADLDLDGMMADSEKFELVKDEDEPYIFQTTIELPFKNALFKSYPILLQYWKNVEWDELKKAKRC